MYLLYEKISQKSRVRQTFSCEMECIFVLGKYGKGLVPMALAESYLEKGQDIFEIFSSFVLRLVSTLHSGDADNSDASEEDAKASFDNCRSPIMPIDRDTAVKAPQNSGNKVENNGMFRH